MARYRGRHRTPSTTGRAVARTALAGAVAGAPLVFAVPAAHAASDSTWDRVAQCESGGRWNIDTGNGFKGGLQFTASTWRAFGGGQFASSANRASRAQQIVVAERVLAQQGWGAWPVCSRKAGATGQSATQRHVPTAVPARTVRLSAPTPKGSTATHGSYVVRRGDTLGSIARAKRIPGGWHAIVAKNPALRSHPNRIMPGQRLAL